MRRIGLREILESCDEDIESVPDRVLISSIIDGIMRMTGVCWDVAREVIVEGRTYREAAESCGISLGTTSQHMSDVRSVMNGMSIHSVISSRRSS